jgi:hypothetical protein
MTALAGGASPGVLARALALLVMAASAALRALNVAPLSAGGFAFGLGALVIALLAFWE